PQQRPNKDWLKFCATSRAKAKIRHHIRTEQRERGRQLGNDLTERELRKYGVSLTKSIKSGDLDKAAEKMKIQSGEELLILVGYGKITASQVAEVLVPEDRRKQGPVAEAAPSSNPITNLIRKVTRAKPTGIKVQGEDDVLVRFAKCCNPLPGDSIVGFITRGRGVTVHTKACQKAFDVDPDRRIDVEWDGKGKTMWPVQIQVVCADKPGLLANISQAFGEVGVNIPQAHCRATEDHRAVNTFQFSVADLEQLRSVIKNIQKIQGVFSVERL